MRMPRYQNSHQQCSNSSQTCLVGDTREICEVECLAMSEDVVVTLVNQESEDLDFPGVHHVKVGGVEEREVDSASEGDIEIEHLVVEDGGSDQHGGDDAGDASQVTNITFDVRKRTLIMLWQRTILEEFYRAGMTSASMQLQSLHLAAAEKTGLDCGVVKVHL